MSTTNDLTGLSDDDIKDSYTSEFEYRTITLNWTIQDLEFTFKYMKMIESPRFPSSESENGQWYIQLLPTELKENNEEEVEVYLKNTVNCNECLKVDIYFYKSSWEVQHFYAEFEKLDEDTCWSITGGEFYKLLLSTDKSLPKSMTVTCELSFITSVKNNSKQSMAVPLKSQDALKHFASFFDDQVFKDVKFVVEEKEFSAHKSILALRSPVFAAMLKNKLNEEPPLVIEIKDVSFEVFQSMLKFIYTDEVEDLKECALELFYAADKYQLERLKKLCINSLYNNMSVETVVKIFQLADIFSISKLKKKAEVYLISRLKAVEKSEEYINLLKSNPHFAEEIIKLQKKMDYEIETLEDVPESIRFEIRS